MYDSLYKYSVYGIVNALRWMRRRAANSAYK